MKLFLSLSITFEGNFAQIRTYIKITLLVCSMRGGMLLPLMVIFAQFLLVKEMN